MDSAVWGCKADYWHEEKNGEMAVQADFYRNSLVAFS